MFQTVFEIIKFFIGTLMIDNFLQITKETIVIALVAHIYSLQQYFHAFLFEKYM